MWPAKKLKRGFSVKSSSFHAPYTKSKRKPILTILRKQSSESSINIEHIPEECREPTLAAIVEEFKQPKECIHLAIAKEYITQLDVMNNVSPEDDFFDPEVNGDHNYASISEEVEIQQIQDRCVCIFDKTTATYGIIMVMSNSFWCSVCNSSVCSHIRMVNSYKETPFHDLPDELCDIFTDFKTTSNQFLVQKSTLKIPFRRSTTLTHTLLSLHDKIQKITVLQPTSQCRKCSSDSGEYQTVNERCPITASQNIYFVILNMWICHQCHEKNVYEGLDDGLLNMGSYIVTHELLRSYLHGFLHGKCTLFAFYTHLKEVHLDFGLSNFLTYNKLKNAWYCYVSLLDVDYQHGFCCNICGENPRTIICDGTSLSFRKKMLLQPGNIKAQIDDEKLLYGSSFKEMVFVANATTRKMLKRYSKLTSVSSMSNEEFTSMISALEKEIPELANFINDIEDGIHCPPTKYKSLIASLSSSSPVCVLIPNNKGLHDALQKLCDGDDIQCNPDLIRSLQEQSPLLFDIYKGCRPISTCMKELLKILSKKAEQPFVTKENHTVEKTLENPELACFPSLPILRGRGMYYSDKTVFKKKEKCKKVFSGHPTLLPGIFTIFCSHGICYGYQVMRNHESANIPFTIFRTRFPTAPDMVIYDFACSLHSYCLRRDPLFFRDTKFFVDRFHWYNHKACSRGYNLHLYLQHNTLNSQVNEQGNAGLKRIKDQLSYMTQQNFMTHCRLFLYNKNINKING